MKKSHKDKAIELGELTAYVMCKRKKKFKSSEAGHLASRFSQRKYKCPICKHWHLTKAKDPGGFDVSDESGPENG